MENNIIALGLVVPTRKSNVGIHHFYFLLNKKLPQNQCHNHKVLSSFSEYIFNAFPIGLTLPKECAFHHKDKKDQNIKVTLGKKQYQHQEFPSGGCAV